MFPGRSKLFYGMPLPKVCGRVEGTRFIRLRGLQAFPVSKGIREAPLPICVYAFGRRSIIKPIEAS